MRFTRCISGIEEILYFGWNAAVSPLDDTDQGTPTKEPSVADICVWTAKGFRYFPGCRRESGCDICWLDDVLVL